MQRRILPWLIAGLFLAGPVRAQPSAVAEADALFEEGRKLLDAGALAEACPKLERSFQLAPRLGTMLNLGACFERRGQLSRALVMYESAATLAQQTGRSDREKTAREYAAQLEAKVAKLLLVVEDPSTELTIQVDGETLTTRSGLLPVDPGARKVTARSPGRLAFETVATFEAGRTTTVRIPRLREAPAAPVSEKPAETPRKEEGPTRTILLVGGLGVGAVALGLGTALALSAKGTYDESRSHCDPRGCDDRGLAAISDARSTGDFATVAFVVGGAALAATAVLFLVTKSTSPRAVASTTLTF